MRNISAVALGFALGVGVSTMVWFATNQEDFAGMIPERSSLTSSYHQSDGSLVDSSVAWQGDNGSPNASPKLLEPNDRDGTPPLDDFDIAELLKYISQRDGRSLANSLLRLLKGGDEGRSLLLQFLRDHFKQSQRSIIDDSRLRFAILSLVYQHEEQVASFLSYALRETDIEEDFDLQEVLLNILPDFLTFHDDDRFLYLRQDLEKELYEQLHTESSVGWSTALAVLRELGIPPDVSFLDEALSDPTLEEFHVEAVEALRHSGDDQAWEVLDGFVRDAKDHQHPAVRNALQSIARSDLPYAEAVFEDLLDTPEIRTSAITSYYDVKRPASSYGLAEDFLHSDSDADRKHALLMQLWSGNREVLTQLNTRIEAFAPETQALIVKFPL